MKKLFSLALVAMLATAANAQVFVGGEMGISTSKTSVGDFKSDTYTSFSIAPMVGYELDKEWAIAMRVGYGHNTEDGLTIGDYHLGGTNNTFMFNPFVRCKFVRKGNFFAFLDGGLRYDNVHYKGCDSDLNVFRVALNPGIGYRLAKHVSITASLGDLSFRHTWVGDDITNNAFNLSLTDNIAFGVQFEL